MGLKRRGNVWHWNGTVEGTNYRLSTGKETKAEAQDWVKDTVKAIKAGTYVPPGKRQVTIGARMLLSDAFTKALNTHWRGMASEELYGQQSKRIVELMADPQLNEITTAKVNALKDSLCDLELSEATVNNYLACLSSVLTIATDKWELALKRPRFDFFEVRNGRIWLFTEADKIAALQAAPDRDMADLLICLDETGCRLSEALKLTRFDIDVQAGVIKLWDTKNKDSRGIPMTDRLISMFKARDCKPFGLTKDQASHRWETIRHRLGRDGEAGFIMHTYRHTRATQMLEAGISVYTVKEWLGHKTITTTMRYAKMTRSQLEVAVKMLNSAAIAKVSIVKEI